MKTIIKVLTVAFLALQTSRACAKEIDIIVAYDGEAKYSDGTAVDSNEWYALVWVADGQTFKGFNADCSLVETDTSLSRLFLAFQPTENPWDEGVLGLQFSVTDDLGYCGLEGTWNVYMLDTRKPTGEVTVEEGKTNLVYAVSGSVTDANGFFHPEIINASGYLGSASNNALYKYSMSTISADEDDEDDTPIVETVEATQVTADPPSVASAEPPRVTGIRVEGGKVYLTVTNTLSCIWYNATKGATPQTAQSGSKVAKSPLNGSSTGGTITLEVPKADEETSAFYKVIQVDRQVK